MYEEHSILRQHLLYPNNRIEAPTKMLELERVPKGIGRDDGKAVTTNRRKLLFL